MKSIKDNEEIVKKYEQEIQTLQKNSDRNIT